MARRIEDIIENEKPEVVKESEKQADDLRIEMRISEIREIMGSTQQQVAQAMGVTQPTVAGIEKEGHDIRLSTIKRYVETMGGHLRLDVEFPDGSHRGFTI